VEAFTGALDEEEVDFSAVMESSRALAELVPFLFDAIPSLEGAGLLPLLLPLPLSTRELDEAGADELLFALDLVSPNPCFETAKLNDSCMVLLRIATFVLDTSFLLGATKLMSLIANGLISLFVLIKELLLLPSCFFDIHP